MQNNDLIFRAAAIKEIESIRYCGDFISALIHLPAVDAVPVVYAHWEEEPGNRFSWHCSNCVTVQGIPCIAMAYCPHCGARMAEHPLLADGCNEKEDE